MDKEPNMELHREPAMVLDTLQAMLGQQQMKTTRTEMSPREMTHTDNQVRTQVQGGLQPPGRRTQETHEQTPDSLKWT